ncbi:MAG: triphosphoribosyl-dephospho-CoA synthase [Synergistetes bacterium]|nr:triphosphoribosyl-dephospho-CoA synthase [Synergistota bacterium]
MCGKKKSFIVRCAQLAGLYEAAFPKPGNVYPFKGFPEMDFADFILASVNMGISLYDVDVLGVGELIYRSLERTYKDLGVNINLGVVLLIVPLAKAYWLRGERESLRDTLCNVLDSLSIEDAMWVYKGIRMVSPGGMGRSKRADIRDAPDVTLKEAMNIAKDRDSIAYEYASCYEITFDFLYPRLVGNRCDLSLQDAVVQVFLELLSTMPDSLIARKYGEDVARDVINMAKSVLSTGGMRSIEGRKAVSEFDAYLRGDDKKLNPGTSADLIASALMVYFLEGNPI